MSVVRDRAMYGKRFLGRDCCVGGRADHVDSHRMDPADVPATKNIHLQW